MLSPSSNTLPQPTIPRNPASSPKSPGVVVPKLQLPGIPEPVKNVFPGTQNAGKEAPGTGSPVISKSHVFSVKMMDPAFGYAFFE
jgi:hypothetical protein